MWILLLYYFHSPLDGDGGHGEDGGHDGEVRHEVGQPAEVRAELPISVIVGRK